MLEATSTGFNPEYIGILPRWFGRIVSSATWQDNIVPNTFSDTGDVKGWAFRYKVRIFSWNTGDPGVVSDEKLLMANVVLPVTAGSGHGGYFETPALAAGSVVTGFFLDGEGGQEPYIDGVLANANDKVPKKQGTGPIAGYQQFNDTYGPKAKVADFLIKTNTSPNTDTAYIANLLSVARKEDQEDKDVKTSLASTRKCKKNNSEMKGIQLTIKNMINEVEKAKKKLTKAQGFIGEINRITSQVRGFSSRAAQEVASYMKTIMGGVRGYVLKKVKAGIQDVAPFLFPTDIPKLQQQLSESLNGLSCGFAKIVNGLQKTFEGLLDSILGKFINAPMCAIENIVSKLVDGVLGQITGLIDSVVGPLASFITGLTGKAMNLIGSAFNALNMVMGILTFFQCDEEPSCSEYDDIKQSGQSTDGGDADGQGQSSDDTNANIVDGANEEKPTQSSIDEERVNERQEFLTTTTQEELDLINEERAIGGQEPLTLDQVQQPQTSESQPVPLQVIPFEENQQEPERQIRNQPSVTDQSNLTDDQIESEKARRLLAGEEVDGVTFELE